jgi:hypothetical protein
MGGHTFSKSILDKSERILQNNLKLKKHDAFSPRGARGWILFYLKTPGKF